MMSSRRGLPAGLGLHGHWQRGDTFAGITKSSKFSAIRQRACPRKMATNVPKSAGRASTGTPFSLLFKGFGCLTGCIRVRSTLVQDGGS
jgi:hypothetical protein